MLSVIRSALMLFALLSVLTGVIYPIVVTGIGLTLFPVQAGGSLLHRDGHPIGSALIGQPFGDPKYFWSRPSATSPQPYNALASSGSNFGPLNPALTDAIKARVAALHAADPSNSAPVPVDLVTASGSGLDPDISLAAAYYQLARVARARALSPGVLQAMIDRHARGGVFGLFGEPRVNVLELNLALGQPK